MYQSDINVSFARSAFNGVSFSPERRGDTFVNEYSASLAEDYEILKAHATKGGTLDLLPGIFERYRAGFRRVNNAYLASSSRCVSWMIAGPSKFPAARMQKRADICHKRLNELCDYRARVKAKMIRDLRPDLRPIMSGDADAIERLQEKIELAEAVQGRMKRANATIRKYKKDGPEAQVIALAALGFSEGRAYDLLKPDFCGRIGFADFELTNNNANIRRMRQRLETLTRNKVAEVVESEGVNGVRLEDDPPANRIRLFFPGKPDEKTRTTMKAKGFRWTPSLECWQAYRNSWSIELAKSLAA